MANTFDVVIELDSETKQLYASVPSLPGCYSYADSLEELLKNIKEAIELYLDALKEKRQKVEVDSVLGMVKVTV